MSCQINQFEYLCFLLTLNDYDWKLQSQYRFCIRGCASVSSNIVRFDVNLHDMWTTTNTTYNGLYHIHPMCPHFVYKYWNVYMTTPFTIMIHGIQRYKRSCSTNSSTIMEVYKLYFIFKVEPHYKKELRSIYKFGIIVNLNSIPTHCCVF